MRKALAVTTLIGACVLMCFLTGCSGNGSPAARKPDGKSIDLAEGKGPAAGKAAAGTDAVTSAAPLAGPKADGAKQPVPAVRPGPTVPAVQPGPTAPAEAAAKQQPAAPVAVANAVADTVAAADDQPEDEAEPEEEPEAAAAADAADVADDEAEPAEEPAPEVEVAPEQKPAKRAGVAAEGTSEEPKGKVFDLPAKPTQPDTPEVARPEPDAKGIREREDVADLYMRAQGHYYDGDLEAARGLLKRIRKGQPYYDMAQRFMQLVDAEAAKAERQENVEKEEAEYREGKVKRLYREALRAYNAKKYVEAVDLADQAYRIDPNNMKVRELRADAQMARGNAEMQDNSLNQDARISEVLANIEKIATVPPELPRAARPLNDDEPDPDADAKRVLDEKLNQRITVNLEATPLDYLVNILFRATGVNIVAKPEDLEGKTITLHVEDIKLIDLLDYVSKTMGVTFTRSRNALWLQGGGDTQSGPLMDWRIVPLNKGLIDVTNEKDSDTSDLEKALEKLADLIDWPQGSQWYLDRMTNSLVVRTTSESMEQFTRLVRALDVTPVQVLIETKFIQISSREFSDLGIDWKLTSDLALAKKDGQNKIQVDSGMGVKLPAPVTAGPDFDDTAGFDAIVAGVMTVPQFQMTLHALKASGHTSDLGGPQIIAVNNGVSTIEVTQDDFYVKDYDIDRQDFSGSSFYNNVDQNNTIPPVVPGTGNATTNYDWAAPVIKPVYEKVETGFKLKVKPSVGRDMKDITLYLEPEINDLVDTLKTPIASTVVTGQPLQVEQPIVAKRKMTVKLTVADGYVVAMGGLVKQKKEKGVVKVPILGDIPLLGLLFRHENEKNVKYNLLIFVTAKILTSEGRTYVGAGPEGAAAAGAADTADRARELRDRVEVKVVQ